MIDDFEINTVSETERKIYLSGSCYWLNGRRGADSFEISYAKTTKPKLYSLKFKSLDDSEPQDLYVGKTFTGWEIGDA